jgi:hypothetical protein
MPKSATSAAPKKTKPSATKERKRFNTATASERRAKIPSPCLSPKEQVLAQLLPASVLVRIAQKWNAGDVRQRKLTCVAFFWLTLLAVGPGGPLSLHKCATYFLVAQGVAGLSLVAQTLSKEAVSENFRERPWLFFAAVLTYVVGTYTHLWGQYVGGVPVLAPVQNLSILLVDATIMRVARCLVETFPVSRAKNPADGAGTKLQARFDLLRGLPDIVALAPQAKNERKIGLLRPAGEAVLYIFDLGFWTYALFDTIIDQHQHFLSRLRGDCNPLIRKVYVGNPAWVGKRLKEITLTGAWVDLWVNVSSANAHNPQMKHEVRLVGQWNRSKKRWHLYLTSLPHGATWPAVLIVELYRLRWQIEILFRTLKSTLQISNFIAHTENGIRLQIYAALIHYVLTQLLILKVAHETGFALEEFSVPYCLEVVQQVLAHTEALLVKDQVPDWEKLEREIAQLILTHGLRPNRRRKPLITRVKKRLGHLKPSLAGKA